MIRNVSMTAIGKAAGVSHATVSDVLNDRWREKGISQATRDRVARIAAEMNYRPNRLVRGVFSGRTHSLGFVVPALGISYFPRILEGIEAEAQEAGYQLLIAKAEEGEKEASVIEALLERRVDGLIMVPKELPPNIAYYRRLVDQGVPLVFVDAYIPAVPCPAVVGSDEEGMRMAARRLIELGHKRIAYAGDQPWICHISDRLRGFQKALAEAGLPQPKVIEVNGDLSAIQVVLRQPNRPTAVVAATDYMALDIMKVAESEGLRLPEDLAIVGFSDYVDKIEFHRVPLTSVRMDLDQMGRLAMRRFLQEVEKPSKRHDLVRVDAKLVVRASSGGRIRVKRKARGR